jgi:hypothetical protein
MRTAPFVFVLGLVAIIGCSKAADPAYLSAIESAATELCKCSALAEPERVTCMGVVQKKGTVHPKEGPGGEAPGLYEGSLDDASQAAIEFARKKASACEAVIMGN